MMKKGEQTGREGESESQSGEKQTHSSKYQFHLEVFHRIHFVNLFYRIFRLIRLRLLSLSLLRWLFICCCTRLTYTQSAMSSESRILSEFSPSFLFYFRLNTVIQSLCRSNILMLSFSMCLVPFFYSVFSLFLGCFEFPFHSREINNSNLKIELPQLKREKRHVWEFESCTPNICGLKVYYRYDFAIELLCKTNDLILSSWSVHKKVPHLIVAMPTYANEMKCFPFLFRMQHPSMEICANELSVLKAQAHAPVVMKCVRSL